MIIRYSPTAHAKKAGKARIRIPAMIARTADRFAFLAILEAEEAQDSNKYKVCSYRNS